MTINVKININSPTGKRLEKELRQYPEVVEFVDINIVSDIHHKGYTLPHETFKQTSAPILINADTEAGKTLIRKLESHRKVVRIEYPFPVDSHGNQIETLTVAESAKLAFEKLGEKYNCRFENKHTR